MDPVVPDNSGSSSNPLPSDTSGVLSLNGVQLKRWSGLILGSRLTLSLSILLGSVIGLRVFRLFLRQCY